AWPPEASWRSPTTVGLPRESRISRALTETISDIAGSSAKGGVQTVITTPPLVKRALSPTGAPLDSRATMANLRAETKLHEEKRQGGTKMLVTWTPFNELARLQQGLDHLFGANGANHRERVAGFAPAVDVVEDEQKFELYADLPGVAQEDLDVQVEKNVLTIKGTRKLERKGERAAGAFSRSFTLPKQVDVEQIAASLKDGV